MGTAPTTVPSLTPDQFAARMAANFPPQWASPQSMLPGGAGFAQFNAFGTAPSFLTSGLQYALAAMRIQTAAGDALDLASLDFFGPAPGLYALPRVGGESDASFAARILQALFPPSATRQAMAEVLEQVTGFPARLSEPWRPADTGAWGVSYWDVDTPAAPFRWTGGGAPNALAYQGFVEVVLPGSQPFGPGPTPCYDVTFFWGAPGSSFLDGRDAPPTGPQIVYNAINRTKVYGTIVWVMFVPPPSQNSWDQPGVSWDESGVAWDS